jgi:c(7)-type cytochrome triheme protein
MMKALVTIIAMLVSLVFSGLASAVSPGETIEFNNSPEGKVTFDGELHQGKGFKCKDCHTAIFEKARTVQIKKADHDGGKACFTCHDGNKSFAAKDNCARCHKK